MIQMQLRRLSVLDDLMLLLDGELLLLLEVNIREERGGDMLLLLMMTAELARLASTFVG